MSDRCLAISILQKARDALCERLTERVIESRAEIEADAEGASYLSEIETIYEQIGGRLAHVNAMLANLPAAAPSPAADAMASEIIYADLASAYPTGLDLEAAAPLTLLALPAPVNLDDVQNDWMSTALGDLVRQLQADQIAAASRLISELFDVKPSQGRRAAAACARQMASEPHVAARIAELPKLIEDANEYPAAAVLGECFEFPAIEALALARALKLRRADPNAAD